MKNNCIIIFIKIIPYKKFNLMTCFSLVIPIYNEAENIGRLIIDIKKNIDLNNNEIVIIDDDGSTDETQKC